MAFCKQRPGLADRAAANSLSELREKKDLYLARGAQEYWICDDDGTVRFHGHGGAIARSRLFPGFPGRMPMDLPPA